MPGVGRLWLPGWLPIHGGLRYVILITSCVVKALFLVQAGV